MKTQRIYTQRTPVNFLFMALALLIVCTPYAPRMAEANTSAGTLLTNSVTVNYKDNAGIAQTAATGSVTVTVALVGMVEWLTAPTAQDASSGTALSAAYNIILHNQGNGTDTFALTDLTTNGTGLGAGTFTITPASRKLVGTVSSGAGIFSAGVTSIPVSNLVVGDLTAGTTIIRIGASTFTVAAGSTATSLKVTGDATAVANGAGIQIGEQYTITYNGSVGTLSAGTANADHTHQLKAVGTSVNGNTAATANSTTWLTHVHGATLTVTKYVRNATNTNGNTGGSGGTSLYSNTYYTGGVTGNPGDTMEYVVVVKNTNAAPLAIATAVIFEDTFPLYTSYVSGQTKVDKGTGVLATPGDTETCGDATGIFETDTCGASNPAKLKVFLGAGGLEGATYAAGGTGGTIPGGTGVTTTWGVLYRLTIK